MIRRQFEDLFNESMSKQHEHQFRKYFGSDIRTKMFTVDEFGKMFQVKTILSMFLL